MLEKVIKDKEKLSCELEKIKKQPDFSEIAEILGVKNNPDEIKKAINELIRSKDEIKEKM